ncbi:MAG: hypothetical protein C4530_15215 [Desulfobacteraceae bacterium]|nr:MAG: hypothetical protein C4530_15215 [Desulfobacteraceae bacterium]
MTIISHRPSQSPFKIAFHAVVLVLIVFFCLPIHAGPEKKSSNEIMPVLTEGMVTRIDREGKTVPVAPGDRFRPSGRVRTGMKARAALELSASVHLRLDALSEVRFDGMPEGDGPEGRLWIMVLNGEVWVNASAVPEGFGGLNIRMPFASIRMNGGICRLTVFSDGSSRVKVYSGPVEILKPETGANPANAAGSAQGKGSWSHILNSMQQIHVRPDGTATNPFQLMKKVDETPWVEWNRSMDERLGPNPKSKIINLK